jgi:CRP/FNR family cyclic AMP-dependent transcriptional regulator
MRDSFWSNIFKERDETTRTVTDRLRSVPLFKTLDNKELRAVAHIMHIRTYKPGETVFYQDEPGVGMYVVEEGRVHIKMNIPNKSPSTLAELEEGDFFGELALLDESPRSADAVSQTDSVLIGFFRPDLMTLLDREPRLGGKIVLELTRIVGIRLRNSNTELQDIKQRLADTARDRTDQMAAND